MSFLYSDSQNHDSRYLQDHASDHRFSQATDYVLRMADLCAQIQAYSSHNHDTHTPVYPFNGPLSRTTRVGRYQKGKTNLDFTEARDSE